MRGSARRQRITEPVEEVPVPEVVLVDHVLDRADLDQSLAQRHRLCAREPLVGDPPVDGLAPDYITQTVHGVHFYDSMVVVEKRAHGAPQPVYAGEPTVAMTEKEREFIAFMDREARGH